MAAEAFLRWRKNLGYGRAEAAEKLGVHRGTIRHWENGSTRIPKAIELACSELTRRWKQRPDFGPVILVYASGPLWRAIQKPSRVEGLHCERHLHNRSALEKVARLRSMRSFDALMFDESGELIWTCPEMLLQAEAHQQRG